MPGHVLGYDQETGFGLVQALGRLNVPPLEVGARLRVGAGDRAIIAAEGGRRHAVATTVVARQEFAGYWEYLLDRAIFTAPAHPFWGGAALIGGDGSLIGVGSLHVQHSSGRELRRDVNMVVPIDLLPPILDDLLTYGRRNQPPRPWLPQPWLPRRHPPLRRHRIPARWCEATRSTTRSPIAPPSAAAR